MENREIAFKFIYKNDLELVKISRPYSLDELINITEDDIYYSLSDCICQPIGETNVVECNCDAELEGYTLWDKVQFTGLKDKNGVEIYEGDIIPCKIGVRQYSGWNVGDPDASLNGVIEWNPYQACWHIKFKEKNKYDVISMSIGWGSNPEFEVIGNIYEHPHLLTNDK